MASQKRKRTPARTTRSDAKPRRPRRTTPAKHSSKRSAESAKALLPYFLSFCILVCLAAFAVLGYRTATASDFFDVKNIEIRGTERASKASIDRIIRSETEKSGTWDADLGQIKAKIEKLQFVRSAAVSRVLPDGIRVVIEEKVPVALIKMKDGVFMVDEAGTTLARSGEAETELRIIMTGWNEERSPKADGENKIRLARYTEMLIDLNEIGLAERITAFDLSNVREPRAAAEDSGMPVMISLGRENFGENLKRGLEAIAGKGDTFEAIDLFGSNMRLVPRKK